MFLICTQTNKDSISLYPPKGTKTSIAFLHVQHIRLFRKTSQTKIILHYFLITKGPVLSPVSLLCFTCAPSQYGKFFERQHRQYATTPLSDLDTESSMSWRGQMVATLGSFFWMEGLICLEDEAVLGVRRVMRMTPMPIPITMLIGSRGVPNTSIIVIGVLVKECGSGVCDVWCVVESLKMAPNAGKKIFHVNHRLLPTNTDSQWLQCNCKNQAAETLLIISKSLAILIASN